MSASIWRWSIVRRLSHWARLMTLGKSVGRGRLGGGISAIRIGYWARSYHRPYAKHSVDILSVHSIERIIFGSGAYAKLQRNHTTQSSRLTQRVFLFKNNISNK